MIGASDSRWKVAKVLDFGDLDVGDLIKVVKDPSKFRSELYVVTQVKRVSGGYDVYGIHLNDDQFREARRSGVVEFDDPDEWADLILTPEYHPQAKVELIDAHIKVVPSGY